MSALKNAVSLAVNHGKVGLRNGKFILCTLSFLANGSYQKIIGKNVDTYISQTSASRAIHEVVDALNNKNLISKYIRFPQNQNDRQVIKSRFYEKFKIPGVLGCVDGTLISMIRPKEHEERFYCRKGYHARNVLIASFRPLLSCAPVAMVALDRNAHSQDITKNIQYISNDKIKLKTDPTTMKLDKRVDRPMCVMINWLLARQKHVMKYATLYLEQGFDVLSVSCTPWQLMWPQKGTQLVAEDLIKFMAMNENEHPLVVHGFSVGGYLWGELCAHVIKNKELYQPVLDRVVAQVWDSAADISEITIGVPAAVFPKNQIMQKTLRAYMEYHMKTFHDAATIHYIRSSQLFHTNLCHAPALFLLSRSDPVGAEKSNRSVHDSWVQMGMKCTWKCWDRSPHVQHYTKHTKEYVAALYQHLDAYGLVSQPDKMRMRL